MANEMILFDPKHVVETGNKFLGAILAHEMAKEAAEQELAAAQERESFINVEMTKMAMWLHSEGHIDLLKAYGDKRETSALYRSILVEIGVLKREITDDDTVVYAFTDPALKEAYSFEQAIANYKHGEDEDKPKYSPEQVAEHKQRRSRRNALNIRLANVCKAALALYESKATIDDLSYREKEDGTRVAVLTKGPKEVMGKSASIDIVVGNAAKAKGATLTPTISGLAKAADHKHKPATKQTTETAKKDGAPKDENDFLALINAAMMAVKAREGTFTDAEKQAMKNLGAEIVQATK